MYKNLIEWLKKNGWQYILNTSKVDIVNNTILNRYNNLPDAYVAFLECFESVSNNDDTEWFLCEKDFKSEAEDEAFRWNEFEMLSLEAAEGDDEWQTEIKSWWSTKLPIVMSVKNGYLFYAIDTENDSGIIVKGQDPEFEEVCIVADSFEDFIDMIINNKISI